MTNENSYLKIDGVKKSFTSKKNGTFHALDTIDLDIKENEFVSLIGPSGCGKSTLLNMVAGLVEATSGRILLEKEEVKEPGVERGVVFQGHALLPWMTVSQNIMFALDCVKKDLTKKEKKEQVDYYLDMVKLSDAADKKPKEISGGMQQRVGIARTFAIEPKILLLDEPFGALDALTREILQGELKDIWEKDKRTVLMVTHDVEEAILLSDRIVVMSHGPEANIREQFQVDIDRPRYKEKLMDDQRYTSLRKELYLMLSEEKATAK
jgi:nitrate/nitrite transport system ATP-binding protein